MALKKDNFPEISEKSNISWREKSKWILLKENIQTDRNFMNEIK
jgi:hypothetical protein